MSASINKDTLYAGIAAGARFIARVLEKGGLSGFIDTLSDSRPRLQQAYLNIFNIVFAASYINISNAGGRRGAAAPLSDPAVCDAALKPVRFFFVKSQSQLLSILSRLVDQGGSSAIRGKATLAVELLCRFHPPVVVGLADCRFQHVLSKLLEINDDGRHGIMRGGDGREESESQLSYVLRCAQSMQRYVRLLLVRSLQGLTSHLKSCTAMGSPRAGANFPNIEGIDLSATNILDTQDTQVPMSIYSTPSKHPSASTYKTPHSRRGMHSESPPAHQLGNPSSPRTRETTPGSANAAGSRHTRVATATTVTSRMTDYSAIVRSCVTMTANPVLRRLVISASYIDSLASAFALLCDIIRQPEWASRLADEGKDEAVSIAEQAVLLALESVAQVIPLVCTISVIS